MSAVRAFLVRPLVQVAMGVLTLLWAIRLFATGGGSGPLIGLLFVFLGGRLVWKGFTGWQSERT